MNMVSMSISKEGERQRRRYLPLEIRSQMHKEVLELRKQGLKYIEIQREIAKKYGKQLNLSQIYFWINKIYHPLGGVNKFNNKPSPESAHIVGAIFTDGFIYFDGNGYIIELSVNDYEFAEEFGGCLAKVLGRKEPYKPFWNESRKQWVVKAHSILLYKFLNRPLEELKPYIEYSKDTVSAFLRALFDAEGFMHKSQRILMLHNTNEELLNYTKYLLKKYFDIDATGPHLARKGGKVLHFLNGKIVKTKKDYYLLYIRTKSLSNFYKFVKFTIKRKQQRLFKAIKQ